MAKTELNEEKIHSKQNKKWNVLNSNNPGQMTTLETPGTILTVTQIQSF